MLFIFILQFFIWGVERRHKLTSVFTISRGEFLLWVSVLGGQFRFWLSHALIFWISIYRPTRGDGGGVVGAICRVRHFG